MTLYGVVARVMNLFVGVRKKHWVFGADNGETYREGSKHMLEYMMTEHRDYRCVFVTRNRAVYDELRRRSIPVEMNNSLWGIVCVARAECVFTTQVLSDVLFAYRKRGRRFFYMGHGQPYKVAYEALDGQGVIRARKTLKDRLVWYFNVGYRMKDVEFVPATSEFLVPYMRDYFRRSGVAVKVLGMARNDALFSGERMKRERWIGGTEGKFIITYMPTHRLYGRGAVPRVPLRDREMTEWMRENGVLFLVKQHPNMISKAKAEEDTDCIRDITREGIDPQVCLFHSDVLVTDYSSAWIDYLLLRRPVVFYIYDDFCRDDVGLQYDIRGDFPGLFCPTEEGLKEVIRKIKSDYRRMSPEERIVRKYHKYADGRSCERYFGEITRESL